MHFQRFAVSLDILCGMRITIAQRIFLALTVVSLVIVSLNAAFTRWNFERGFLEYVASQEAETISGAAAELASLYQSDGDWEAFRRNPRRWNDFLRENNNEGLPERRPDPGQRPGHPPPPDPLELSRRIGLLDADGTVVIGPPGDRASMQSVPILLDDAIVGYVTIAPRRELTDEIDQSFAREQKRSIYLIAAAALLLAAVISALLARQLTQPIRALAAGARAISAGRYETRITAARHDELGDLASDFNQLAQTLEKNQRSRQQWVADIAHELRTPLAVLRGELDAIEDGVRTFDMVTRQSLQAEVARLTKLVSDLHDLSVYDDGGLDYQSESVDISALLRRIAANSKNRLQDAGVELTEQLPDEAVAVLADAARLEQLFANLIENTIRYTDAPGSLFISCTVDSENVEIDFADSAPGVSEHMLSRLFDRLFRVETSRSRHSGGSGLGLSICKAIVDAHGGSIQAMGSDANGLLIRVTLPLAPATRSNS